MKNIVKLQIIVIIHENKEALRSLKHSVPKKISMVIHDGSNYDYHFIIKELAEEFKKQFICL